MLSVKTLAKGQIVIPAEIRKKLGIEPGSMLEVKVVGDHLEVYPLPQNSIEAFRGSLRKKPSLGDALLREHRDEVKRGG